MILNDKDRTTLDELEGMLLGVLEDHRKDMSLTMHALSALETALQEVRLARRYMGGG